MDFKIELDRTKFPMIWIEQGGFFMHWLPVTKVQIEYFLSSGSANAFSAVWYEDALDYNERVSPGLINAQNYWQAFITGIKPSEIHQFRAWMGDYDLPTGDEWQTAYRALRNITADNQQIERLLATPDLNRRAATLISNLKHTIENLRTDLKGGRTTADYALMRLGVMEYVYRDDRRSTYGGYGQPNSTFFGTTETPDRDRPSPQRLVDENEGAKMPHYGFRFIKRVK